MKGRNAGCALRTRFSQSLTNRRDHHDHGALYPAIAGSFVLLSLLLGYLFSPYWHLFTAFVGANLLQSAFTKWCLMEDISE